MTNVIVNKSTLCIYMLCGRSQFKARKRSQSQQKKLMKKNISEIRSDSSFIFCFLFTGFLFIYLEILIFEVDSYGKIELVSRKSILIFGVLIFRGCTICVSVYDCIYPRRKFLVNKQLFFLCQESCLKINHFLISISHFPVFSQKIFTSGGPKRHFKCVLFNIYLATFHRFFSMKMNFYSLDVHTKLVPRIMQMILAEKSIKYFHMFYEMQTWEK